MEKGLTITNALLKCHNFKCDSGYLPHVQLGTSFSFVVLLYVILFPNLKWAPCCFVCVVRSCVLSHCAGPKVCLAHPWWSEHSLALATSQLAGAGPYASSIHSWRLTTRRSGPPHKTVPVSCLELSRVSTENLIGWHTRYCILGILRSNDRNCYALCRHRLFFLKSQTFF
jgi:hypothetical protein